MQTGTRRNQTLAVNDTRLPQARRRITTRDAKLCTSVKRPPEGTKRGRSPLQRPPVRSRSHSRTRSGVTDGPVQLEHRPAVEVEPGEAAVADKRGASATRGCPF